MIIDMHMHEGTFSLDSCLQLKEMVYLAKKKGLDGICITDHDSLGLKEEAGKFSKQIEYPIFVGVEYNSLDGDIVAFGIDTLPHMGMSAQEFIDYVHSCKGICIAAHPYRHNGRGLGDTLFTVKGLDGIEAFNASTYIQDNLKALRVCKSLGIQAVGSSDCHISEKLGQYATYLPDTVKHIDELIESFKKNICYPMKFIDGAYIKIEQ